MVRIASYAQGGDKEVRLEQFGGREVTVGHDLISFSDGAWHMEAPENAGNTGIGGKGRIKIDAGVPVQTGGLRWLLLPDGAFVACSGAVVVFGSVVKAVNYAIYHSGVPVIWDLYAVNLSDSATTPWTLGLSIVEYSELSEVAVPPLGPGQAIPLGTPTLLLYGDLLRGQLGPARARLRIAVNGREQERAAPEMAVLSFWDWSHNAKARNTIAAFVSPHDRSVKSVVHDAEDLLKSIAGVSDFDRLFASGRSDAARVTLLALYRALAERQNLRWARPQVNSCIGGTETYQAVRPPDNLFGDGHEGPVGATCLDLAVLMASCIEYLGLCPLIILTGAREVVPEHAFVGAWAGTVPGDRGVITSAESLQTDVSSASLYVVECTGVMAGEAAGRKLPFEEAVSEALEELRAAGWCCAVDIAALRPPQGHITPMALSLSPEVVRAFREAQTLAKEKGREAVETGFLVYGLLRARGNVTRRICETLGVDPAEKADRIRGWLKALPPTTDPRPTWSHSECQRLARDFAWYSGVQAISERDLWAALLHHKIQSRSLVGACDVINTTLEQLRAVLTGLFPNIQQQDRTMFPSSRRWTDSNSRH